MTTAAAHAQPASRTVSLRALPSEEVFVVPVRINGGPRRPFLLDTGATVCALFEDSLRRTGLSSDAIAGESRVSGLLGAEIRPTATLASVEIGPLRHEDVRAVVLPRPKFSDDIDGVIGMNVLSGYAFAFDPKSRRIELTPAEAFEAGRARRWDRVRLSANPYAGPNFGLHFAEGSFDGGESPVLIDTGTTPSVLNWEAASFNRMLRRVERELRERYKVQGAIETGYPVVRATMPSIRIGRHLWRQPTMRVLDLEPLEIFGGAGQPLIIAGADMLSVRRFVIDFAGDVMYVDPSVRGEPDEDLAQRRRGAAAPADEQ
ncbi:MAG: retropepsin-like aspartic protease [Parvularculaceae bacterium]